MPKYRSKPVEIEVWQFDPAMIPPDWLYDEKRAGRLDIKVGNSSHVWMTTPHGRVYAEPGDWIIREPSGIGCYPCKPEVFALKYEPVE